MSNRLNTSNRPLGGVEFRSSGIVSNAIPAGQTLPLSVAGKCFKLLEASAPVLIRPGGGHFMRYERGMGLEVEEVNSFSLLEVTNPHAFPVVFQLFHGFDVLIESRAVMPPELVLRLNSAGGMVAITDSSGREITDHEGRAWLALRRAAVIVSNPPGSNTIAVLPPVSAPVQAPLALVPPSVIVQLSFSGNLRIDLGPGGIVSESYLVIPQLWPRL